MSLPANIRHGNMPKRRSKRMGSADLADLLGLEDAFGSPFSMAYRKINDIEKSEETAPMRWGRWLEPLILAEYQLREDAGQIVKTQAYHEYKPWPIASATLDAIEIDPESGEPVDVEAKTTREFRWTELPLPYQAQMQWQMGVSGLNRAKAVVLYKPRTEIDVFVVDFDEALFLKMVEMAREFWERHIEPGILPDPDGHPATTRVLKSFEATEGVIDIDNLAPVVEELGGVKAAIKDLEKHEEALENRIKAYLGNHTVGTIGGETAATWKDVKSRRIDTKSLASELPEIAERFRVPSESRPFRINPKFLKKVSN